MTKKESDRGVIEIGTVAQIVDRRLNEISGHTSLSEIARRMELATANYLSMIRQGKSKLALGRVEDLARHLDIDVRVLFLAALRQSHSEEMIQMMRYVLTDGMTKAERDILTIANENMNVNQKPVIEYAEKLATVFQDNSPSLS